MTDTAPVSVVIPTIGRTAELRKCLESLAACRPRARELLVVDSSRDTRIASIVEEFASIGARTIRCDARGIGLAFNVGLREASNEAVLLTNDDCLVDPSWVGVGFRALRARGDVIVSGRVLPLGDPDAVPSTIDDPSPRDYAGEVRMDVLYTQCMAVDRSRLLAFGGFDEHVTPAVEDNDLSYRWLRAGRRVRYEPAFLVWHDDWRTKEQLKDVYVGYWRGAGVLYGKYLRRGDTTMLRFLARDLYRAARGTAAAVVRGRPRWSDPRRGLLSGFPPGFVRGWRTAGRKSPETR